MTIKQCDMCGSIIPDDINRTVKLSFEHMNDIGVLRIIKVQDLCYPCQNKIAELFGNRVSEFDGRLMSMWGDE